MSKKQKKTNFNKIRELIERIDATTGIFFLKDPCEKISIKEKLLMATFPILVFNEGFLFVSTLLVTNFSLISVIFTSSLFLTFLLLFGTLAKFTCNKSVLKELLNWCESLYDVPVKFNKLVHKPAEARLISIGRMSLNTMRVTRFTLLFNSSMITIGFAIIGIFLPESIYPKFSPPIPFFLPFTNQQTWTAFISTVLVIFHMATHISIMSGFVLAFFYCISIHILGFLDIILDVIGKIKEDMLINLRAFPDKL